VGALRMGALGAALATVASQGLSMLLCALYLRRGGFIFDFSPKSFKIVGARLRVLLKIGIPMSVQNVCSSVSFLFLTAMVNMLDPTAVASAAVGAVGKFNGFGVLPAFAMSNAIAAMCAQNVGAGEWKRTAKTVKVGLLISLCISGVVFLYASLFPGSIMRLFADDPDLAEAGRQYLRSFSFDYLMVPLFAAFNGLFIGAGHTNFTFLTGVTSALLVRIPVCYLFSVTLNMGLFGVGLGAPFASGVAAIMCFGYYLSGKWKSSRILHTRAPEASSAAE
jgi:Na+-driven multidrug efflux pump